MKKLFAIFLATFVTMGVCELGLRFMWHNPYRNETPDVLLKISMNHPNTDYLYSRATLDSGHSRVRLRTDPRSYILPSSQYSDPDATVAFLGGSTTECSFVQEDLRFPALVSQLLAKQSLKVNTLNGAKSGNTLHDSLNILLNRLARDRPDIVVVMHATNDTGVLVRDGDYRSREGNPVSIKDLLKWSLQMTSSNLYWAALVRRAATSSIFHIQDAAGANWRNDRSLMDRLPIEPFKQRLKAFIHISRDFRIQPVLMTQPFSGSKNILTPGWLDLTAQDRFNTIIREVGEEEDVPVIDLVRYLQERVPNWEKPMEVFYDAIHVTDKGSEIYARHITERLLPLIRAIAAIGDSADRMVASPL